MFRKVETADTYIKKPELHVEVEGFSGPLDLLCCMVESREIDIHKIRVSEFVKIYGAFLYRTERASIPAISDFIFAAASILLGKVTALLPDLRSDVDKQYENDSVEIEDDEDLLYILERYKPYRKGAHYLADLKEKRDSFHSRSVSEEPPLYDLGDLFGLSNLWWRIFYNINPRENKKFRDDAFFLDGVPLSVPDEEQVENRISELMILIEEVRTTDLRKILGNSKSVGLLVVTILALLEMSRLQEIKIIQERMFGNVSISCEGCSQQTGKNS